MATWARGGGGYIDNNCNDCVLIKDKNGCDVFGDQNVMYDQRVTDEHFNNGESLTCHGFSGVDGGLVDSHSSDTPVNADFHWFQYNVYDKQVVGAGSSVENVHILDAAMAEHERPVENSLVYGPVGDYINAMFPLGNGKGHNGAIQGQFRVDFTSLTHFDWFSNREVCIAFVHNLGHQAQGRFCYLVGGPPLAMAELIPCDRIPTGEIRISHSRVMNIILFNVQSIYSKAHYDLIDPRLTYKDFLKEAWSTERYGMSYLEYMDHIIDQLIQIQDLVPQGAQLAPAENGVLCKQHPSARAASSSIVSRLLPPASPTSLHIQGMDNITFNRVPDVNFPDKEWGYLALESTRFKFIGPDRELIDMSDASQYLRAAEMIRESGLPNYKGACIPIKSGLNVPAWERYLMDYPDQRLLQYIRFGFPLSLVDSSGLNNKSVRNHFSARQHPQAVQQYISKEISLGAMLGPFWEVPSPYFHCSPLLTCPKDGTKRRVILDLSYPKGLSVNDRVDKLKFDGSDFYLKFPSIDNIVERMNNIKGKVRLAKVDVA